MNSYTYNDRLSHYRQLNHNYRINENTEFSESYLKSYKSGYYYNGDKPYFEKYIPKLSISEFDKLALRHFLSTEGSIDSINTYDNQILTWGIGFSGKAGNLTLALYKFVSMAPQVKEAIEKIGVKIRGSNLSDLAINNHTGVEALRYWSKSPNMLEDFIRVTRHFPEYSLLSQYQTLVKIHSKVYLVFNNINFLSSINNDVEKTKCKLFILHAHHHLPSLNLPISFTNCKSFKEVIQKYIVNSMRYGNFTKHAQTWENNIETLLGSNAQNNYPSNTSVSNINNTISNPIVDNITSPISTSVGLDCHNKQADVLVVQQLLNKHGYNLPENGIINNNIGDHTVLAIFHFQQKHGLAYDGKIGAKGETIRKLVQANTTPSVTVPSPTQNTSYSNDSTLSWPLAVKGRISSYFNEVSSIRNGKKHNGIDIAAPQGTTIIAPADGVVVYATYNNIGGNQIVIEHDNGLRTGYAHMKSLEHNVGARLSRGERIGEIGMTGRTTGPHLHFTLRAANNMLIDPLSHLPSYNNAGESNYELAESNHSECMLVH